MPPPVSTTSCVRVRGVELLRALRRLALEAFLVSCGSHRGVVGTHRGCGSPLNVTGHARGRVVLAQRVTVPVVGHEDAGEIGMADEVDAEEVVRLALGEVRARDTPAVSDGTVGSSAGTAQITRMRRLRTCDKIVGDDLEALGGRRRRGA